MNNSELASWLGLVGRITSAELYGEVERIALEDLDPTTSTEAELYDLTQATTDAQEWFGNFS